MTLNEYQEAASETAVYPEAGQRSDLALAYCALGLGEVGEVQGKIKKILRGDTSVNNRDIISELGDVLWYVSAMAREIGETLESVAECNLHKLSDRQSRGVLKGSGDNR